MRPKKPAGAPKLPENNRPKYHLESLPGDTFSFNQQMFAAGRALGRLDSETQHPPEFEQDDDIEEENPLRVSDPILKTATKYQQMKASGMTFLSRRYFDDFLKAGIQGYQFPRTQIHNTPTMDSLLLGNFILGEPHTHNTPKTFLVENMAGLKLAGYNAIMLEHIFYEKQALLDKLGPGDQSAIAKLCESANRHLKMARTPPKYSYTDIIIAAKRHGIRVLAIDIRTFYEDPTFAKTVQRVPSYNYIAARIIQEHERSAGQKLKWVALVGESHLQTCYQGSPGLAEYTGASAVHIQEALETRIVPKKSINLGVDSLRDDTPFSTFQPQLAIEGPQDDDRLRFYRPQVIQQLYILKTPAAKIKLSKQSNQQIANLIEHCHKETVNRMELDVATKILESAHQNVIDYRHNHKFASIFSKNEELLAIDQALQSITKWKAQLSLTSPSPTSRPVAERQQKKEGKYRPGK